MPSGGPFFQLLLLELLATAVWAANVTLVPTTQGNSVNGEPDVDCASDAIYIGFYTKDFFDGNVFIRGWYGDKNCHATATWLNHVELLVPHQDCGTRRTRSLNPPGLYISAVVIISFHPHLVTHVDKAYEITCFHTEIKDQPTASSPSPLLEPSAPFMPPMPSCKYELFRHAGSLARYVSIGESVFHRWTCSVDSAMADLYCIVINDCYVTDIQGKNKYFLLDKNGCSLDSLLMPQLIYMGNMEAGIEMKAFAFADKPQIYFQCQIEVLLKEQFSDQCPRPSCEQTDENQRFERNVQTRSLSLDAASQQLNVLELSNNEALLQPLCEGFSEDPVDVQVRAAHSQVCVSTAAFGIVISATFLVAICTLIVITVALYRRTVDFFVEHVHEY